MKKQDWLNNIENNIYINSLQELTELMNKDYNEASYKVSMNNIYNYFYEEIKNYNFIKFKKINLIKLDLNKLIRFKNIILNFNNNFEKELKEIIGFPPIIDKFYNKFIETHKKMYNKNSYYKFYPNKECGVGYYFYDNQIIIDLKSSILTIRYKINLNNSKIIISQSINQDLIKILNKEFTKFKFTFVLHKNNILIGYNLK